MRLQTLVDNIQVKNISGLPNLEIKAIAADSRLAGDGSLFVALRGDEFDGHAYAGDAIERGAVAVVGEVPNLAIDVPYIQVENSRQALAELAAVWNGHPSRDLYMIGVTGTDGKSTTCNLLYEILREAGHQVGLITTVNAVIGSDVLDTGLHVTTPSALEVHAYLRKMIAAGFTHCILETTSHGLAQHRVSACDFDLAVVTNITHEHLDYHGSYDAYRAAKAKLFIELSLSEKNDRAALNTAVLNVDDDAYTYLESFIEGKKLTYGTDGKGLVQAYDIRDSRDGLSFHIVGSDYDVQVDSALIGVYNVSNCLAAHTAAVEGLGISPVTAAAGISKMKGVPGRMELIDMGQRFTAIVDFAHTPNALRRALETARALTSGRVLTVFGSAGLRDREKRKLMAEISADLSDITVLTAEDPRTESLDGILGEMAEGAVSRGGVEGASFWRVADRGDALRLAVEMAREDDLVIACGKGHEQSMCFGEIEYPWDDRVALRAAIAEHLMISGYQMPPLPTSS